MGLRVQLGAALLSGFFTDFLIKSPAARCKQMSHLHKETFGAIERLRLTPEAAPGLRDMFTTAQVDIGAGYTLKTAII